MKAYACIGSHRKPFVSVFHHSCDKCKPLIEGRLYIFETRAAAVKAFGEPAAEIEYHVKKERTNV